MKRLLLVAAVSVSALLASPGPASADFFDPGAYTNRIATVHPSSSVYESITPELRATYAGENIYIRFDRVPAAVKVRWVKCGHTSTQDGASSVGGNAVTISTDGGYTIGTNFQKGSCVRLWARRVTSGSTRLSYPIEAYFDAVYHP